MDPFTETFRLDRGRDLLKAELMEMLSGLCESLEAQTGKHLDGEIEAFLDAGRDVDADLQSLIKVRYHGLHMIRNTEQVQHPFLKDCPPSKRMALLAESSNMVMFGRLKVHEGLVKDTKQEACPHSAEDDEIFE
ncbi:hypothetical protein PMIN02_009821 [Paraphaeosphaeria minitans]